jgi:MFS family permease
MEKRWVILFILFFTRISLGFQFQTMGSVSGEVIDELQFNYAEIGSLIGLFMIPGLFLAIPAGLAGNYVSDRFIIGLGLMTLSLGGIIAGFSETFGLFFYWPICLWSWFCYFHNIFCKSYN